MNYDTWKQESREELFSVECDNGYVREDEIPDIDECRNALVDVIAMIYGSEDIDYETFDDRLKYLSVEFDINMPKDKLNVSRRLTKKEFKRNRLLQWYVGYTRAHAELATRR